MNFRKLFTRLAPVALLMAFSSLSFASPANGSFGFGIFGSALQGSNDLLTATEITWNNPVSFIVTSADSTTFGAPNDFQGLLASTGALAGPLSLPTPNLIDATFGPAGAYSFTASSVTIGVNAAQRSISLYYLGTFTDSTSTYDPAAASLTLTFSQTAPGTTVAGSGTFSTPPSPNTLVPEPASMALMGSALVGLGLVGRKKLARR